MQAVTGNVTQMHYDLMSIDIIKPDPSNPRNLLLTPDNLKNEIDPLDENYRIKKRELEKLLELSKSIKVVGVRNAIEVYKVDNYYRIISGERRYLASILAEQTHIPVRIVERPNRLNYDICNGQKISIEKIYLFMKNITTY